MVHIETTNLVMSAAVPDSTTRLVARVISLEIHAFSGHRHAISSKVSNFALLDQMVLAEYSLQPIWNIKRVSTQLGSTEVVHFAL